MMEGRKIIYGIQQVGIGVCNAEEAFRWYGQVLGADLLIFDDRKMATHMARYMGGEPRQKRALLAMHANGGSGYEIWQYEDRVPQAPVQAPILGDTGVNYVAVKTHDLDQAVEKLQAAEVDTFQWERAGADHCREVFFRDPYGNLLCLREAEDWFAHQHGPLGGICGVAIGVKDIERSCNLYSDILGYSQVIRDSEVTDPEQGGRLRELVLAMPQYPTGGFSPLLGQSTVTLLQALDREPRAIFADRYWGDLGYIHVCFDTRNIGDLMQECEQKGYPFKVKSEETFEMGDTNGRWGYLEDDDGSLIEFVEAQRVPLIKPLGVSINMRKRDPHRPLPNWLLKALRLKRVRFRD